MGIRLEGHANLKITTIELAIGISIAKTLDEIQRSPGGLEDVGDERFSCVSDNEDTCDATVAPVLQPDRDEISSEVRLCAGKHRRVGHAEVEPKCSRKKRKLLETEDPVNMDDNVLLLRSNAR